MKGLKSTGTKERSAFLPLMLSFLLGLGYCESVWANGLGDKIKSLIQPPGLSAPHLSPGDSLVPPPGESSYFPVRDDGQPFLLNIDVTVNMTESLNQFYYDPRWRGEVWVPFDQFSIVERGSRLMSTWKEYDEFSELRKFNSVHKFFERWSGFGP